MYLKRFIHFAFPVVTSVLNPKNITYLFLLTGILLFAFPLFILRNAYTIMLPSAMVVGTLFKILSDHQPNISTYRAYNSVNNPQTIKLTISLYMIILSLIIINLHISGGGRNLYVHVGTYSLYLLSISILTIRGKHHISLGLVLITTIFHRGTIYVSSGFAFGTDPHTFYRHAISITQSGDLLQTGLAQSRYFYSPSLPLGGAITGIVSSVPVQEGAMFFFIPFIFAMVSGLLIYNLVSIVWSEKVAVIAAVLYLASDHAIGGSLTIGPTQYGLIMFVIILYLYVRSLAGPDRRAFVVATLLFVSVIMAHQLSTFIIVYCTISFLLFYKIYAYIGVTSDDLGNSSMLIPTFFAVIFIDWIVTRFGGPGGGEEVIFDRFIAYIIRVLTVDAGIEDRSEFVLPPDVTSTSTFASVTLIHVVGMGILFGLAILGSLYWIKRTEGTPAASIGFGIGGIVFMTLFLILGGQFLGLSTLRPLRWFVFLYFPLAVLAAPGLAVLLTLFQTAVNSHGAGVSVVLLLALTGPYIVLMGGNIEGSIDGPLFDDDPGTERLSFNTVEEEKIEFTQSYVDDDSNVVADRRVASVFSRFYNFNEIHRYPIDFETGTLLLDKESDNVILYRQYQSTNNSQYTIEFDNHSTRVYGSISIHPQLKEYGKIYSVDNQSQYGIYFKPGDKIG